MMSLGDTCAACLITGKSCHREQVEEAALTTRPTVTMRHRGGLRCMADMRDTPGEQGLQGKGKEGEDGLVSIGHLTSFRDIPMGCDNLLQVQEDQGRGDDGVLDLH